MAAKTNELNKDLLDIPTVCQYKTLCSLKNEQILNENPEWLKDIGPVPLWSPLKSLSCIEQPADETQKDVSENFRVEIPGRLSSLCGKANQAKDYVNEMDTLMNFHLLNNVLVLCAALKTDFSEWSEKLIDKITNTAISQYPNFLKERSITDKEVKINHLNGLFNIEDIEYKVQIHQVATGVLYTPYGFNQFNLARALSWFFNRYQFGFIKCAQRTLAIGKILNKDQDFFMYDCQSRGYPMFEGQQKNSYILKTPYLQILLYCLLKTLNYAAKINFIMYNVGITIENSLEKLQPKTGVNQAGAKKIFVRPNIQNKAPANVLKLSQKSIQSVRSTASSQKRNVQNSAKNSQNEMLSSRAKENQKILMDPNKMYYVVAVPKTGLVKAKIESKHLIIPEAGLSTEKIKGNEITTPSIDLTNSPSTSTLIPETVEATVIKNPEKLGIKVYLVDNNNSRDTIEPDSASTIKIAHQLRDFFIK